MSEVLQRAEGISERVRGLRLVCPDGPLWDLVSALQLEVAELVAVAREGGETGSEETRGHGEGRRKVAALDGKSLAAGERP
jgi:hypothetical protein